MDRLTFERGGLKKILDVMKTREKAVIDFLNAYSIFLYENNPIFHKSVKNTKNFYNFPDGIAISIAHLIKHGKWLSRVPGPNITQYILNQKNLIQDKKHFFLGNSKESIKKLVDNFEHLEMRNIRHYNPPYIKQDTFSEKERSKIIKLINEEKVDYLWVGLGNPKKEILIYQIIDKINIKWVFLVGAAFDFLSGTKKRAPKPIQTLGLEWLFRLISDFDYSKSKVKNSFRAFNSMNKLIEFRG